MLVQLIEGVASARFELAGAEFSVGRSPENDLYIEEAMVSGRHAVIQREEAADADSPPRYWLRDLDSTNGTFVNDLRVTRHELSHHDLIRFGLHSFLFVDDPGNDIERTKRLKKSWIPGVYYTKD
jgi:pSer/pThr/pTyr-binding forkhead associated (FHA) protein